ncbi:MAG: hypothetical protein FWD46_01070 [Cystobacterineae bacterium]|nr:hypothetical protein [Cystobacterineae bacterium]
MHTLPSIPSPVLLRRLLRLVFLSACLAVFAQAVPPKAKEVLKPYEGTETFRSKLLLLTDGKGHYLALSRAEEKPTQLPAFWGDGKIFFRQEAWEGSQEYLKEKEDGAYVFVTFDITFWEPRTQWGENAIMKTREDGVYVMCGRGRKIPLQLVPAEEAKAIVESAEFYERRFRRTPHLIVRDDKGVYYYVDKSSLEGEKDFQFFIGQRGRFKKAKLQNIVQDSGGEVFATPNGSLRMVIGKSEVYWVQGKKRQQLIKIAVAPNIDLPFVWNDLGMYANKKMDTPCDDI